MRGGELQRREAAAGLHDRGSGQALVAGAGQQLAQVAAQQGRQRGVDLGGRGALVLAERADDLVRERDVDVRQALGQRVRDGTLVLGVRVAVQQRHGDGLGVEGGDGVGDGAGGAVVQPAQRPVRAHALGRRDAQPVGHQRRRVRRAQAVEVGAGLAPERDEVREALRGDKRGARAAALQQRVGRHGHAVGEDLDIARRGPGALERHSHRLHDAARLVVGRARCLRGDQPPAGGEHGVGEGAADVDAKEVHARDGNRPLRGLPASHLRFRCAGGRSGVRPRHSRPPGLTPPLQVSRVASGRVVILVPCVDR